MSKPEFPPELLERCMREAYRERRDVICSDVVEAILRESGHAELVEALKEARETIVNLTGSGSFWYSELIGRIDAVLRKAAA